MPPRDLSRRMPRVVHVTSAHSAFDSRIFYKECVSLADAGYEVIELANHPGNTLRDRVLVRGLGKSQGRWHRLFVDPFAFAHTALRLNADVYHLHDPELLGVGLFLRACGKRVIYDIHEDLPRTVTYKPYIPRRLRTVAAHTIEAFEDLAARGMSGLVAATPTIAERFECLNRQTAIVNNFPILDELAPDAGVRWESRDRAVTYIGNISEERGIRELVAAVDLLPSGVNVSLELAGRWPTASLHNELQASPQWRHVRWHGVLDRGGVRELLSRVRVGLVVLHPEPNFICSHPIKLFEYMAAGIPVIASDFPLWRRIIGGSECGLLVDPADPREIAAAIEYLLTHDAEAEAMGRRGRVAVEQRFNWDREKTKLLSLYTNVLGAPAPVIDKARVAC